MHVGDPRAFRNRVEQRMGLFHCMTVNGIEDGRNAQYNSGLQGKITNDDNQQRREHTRRRNGIA